MTYHYTYKIFFPETGHVYFGVRSCECLPEEDSYMGSPVTFKNYWEEYEPRKVILRTFDNREEACEYENVLIEWAWSVNKSLSLNANILGVKFCTQGTKRTLETIRKTVEKNQKPFHLVSPEGSIIEGINLNLFCLEKGLKIGNVHNVIKGKKLHANGWTASLNSHQLYLECLKIRGVSFSKLKNNWQVTPTENGKRKVYYFKTQKQAFKFRDAYEKKHNYSFRVSSRNKNCRISLEVINEKI